MIFVLDTDDGAFYEYSSEEAAVAACEGLDVEAALYLFWDADGAPLEPEFTVPNKRGFFTSINGKYKLVPASPDHHACLTEILEEVKYLEMSASGRTLEELRKVFQNPGSNHA